MPVAAPMSARGLWLNAFYKSDDEIVVALADALKEEYKAIVDAGFILQLDDAFLAHEYDRLRGLMSEREVHKHAQRCVDLTNYALTGIPEEKVRYHVCWGSWNAPHTTMCRCERCPISSSRCGHRPIRWKAPTRGTSTNGWCGRM